MAPSGGQICKRCHVVAKFNPSHGVNFWVRCASGNVFLTPSLSVFLRNCTRLACLLSFASLFALKCHPLCFSFFNFCSLCLKFKLSPFTFVSTFAPFPPSKVPMPLPPLLVACLASVGITWELCKGGNYSQTRIILRAENYADLTGIELSG